MNFWLKVFSAAFCFLTGSVVGSFLNVCIWRLPRGESIIRPPSQCPNCGRGIRPWDNIPLLSYLILRGRCRGCGAAISPRYPIVETLTGGLAAVLFLIYGPGLQAVTLFILICLLIVITFVDLDRMIIPDKITLPGILIGLVLNVLMAPRAITGFLLGTLVGAISLLAVAFLGELLFKKESMGGGDIKLAAMVGAFLGWKAILLALFVAVIAGALVGITLIVIGFKERKDHIPFGPFIAAGTILVVFWGEAILKAYQQVFLL